MVPRTKKQNPPGICLKCGEAIDDHNGILFLDFPAGLKCPEKASG